MPDNFKCVDSITVVIGGTTSDNKYIDDVEIIAPTMKCHHEQLPKFPIKVIHHFENLNQNQSECDPEKDPQRKNQSVSTVSLTGLCSTGFFFTIGKKTETKKLRILKKLRVIPAKKLRLSEALCIVPGPKN